METAEDKKEQERRDKFNQSYKDRERQNKMYELGLKFDGKSFNYHDINFHWTDLICMSDKEFNQTYEGAKKRKAQIDSTTPKKNAADISAPTKKKSTDILAEIRRTNYDFEQEVMTHDGEITRAAEDMETSLDDLEATAVQKVSSIRHVVEKLNAQAESAKGTEEYYKAMADRFARQRKNAKKSIDYLKGVATELMMAAGEDKLELEGRAVWLQKTESVDVQDIEALFRSEPDLCRVTKAADKKMIKDMYKATGVLPPGVTLTENKSIRGL